MMTTTLVAPGIVQLENGLPYFSASRVAHAAQEHGLTADEAAQLVGELLMAAHVASETGR